MRRRAWRRILFANLTLAASLTAGCAGPIQRNKQANATPRDNPPPAEYSQSMPDTRQDQSYAAAPSRDLQHQGYGRDDYAVNPYENEIQGGFQSGYQSGMDSGYQSAAPATQSRFAADEGSGGILERDLNTLRESERRQEMTLRELQATPGVTPDELQRYEQNLQETRQRISVYSLALQQNNPSPGYSNAGPNRDKGERFLTESASAGNFSSNHEQIRAMAAPGGQAFRPRAEVKMTGPQGPGRPMSGQGPEQTFVSARENMDSGQEVERVVYDPRRDGDFSLFALSGMGADASPTPGGQTDIPGEPNPDGRRVLVAPGSIPPATKASAQSANPPVQTANPPVLPPSLTKPFAGAPVGRAKFPPKKEVEIPDDWTPPADLFSQSNAPEEVQAHPGLYSADGYIESSDWPDREPQTRTPKASTNAGMHNDGFPSQSSSRANKTSVPEQRPLRPEPDRNRPAVSVSTPVISIEQPRKQAQPRIEEKIKITTPSRQQPDTAPVRKQEPLQDEVFVPDLFF